MPLVTTIHHQQLQHHDNCTPLATPCLVYAPQNNIVLSENNTLLSVDAAVVAGNNYTWFKDNLPIATTATNTYAAEGSGEYRVEVNNTSITNPTIPEQNLILVSNNLNVTVEISCIESDSLELVNLYNTMDGANWTQGEDTGWLINSIDNWLGVQLTEDGCHVAQMDGRIGQKE